MARSRSFWATQKKSRRILALATVVWVGAVALTWLSGSGCAPRQKSIPALQAGVRAENCRTCHENVYVAWAQSHHAQANRPVRAADDRPAFTPAVQWSFGNARHTLSWDEEGALLRERYGEGPPRDYRPDMVIGHAPLRQYTVLTERGFWQTTELAYDPVKKQWFDAFGRDNRQPGEWGHWTGRGMNWNSMCAHCHMTGLQKNYNSQDDRYVTTWSEQGISCAQCHGLMAGHAQAPHERSSSPHHAPSVMMETCGSCHSRNELLTGALQPGGAFADYHRLVLPVTPGVYFPDGQIQDEDFEYGSFVRSRMHHAGVTCLDCHDPHSGKTRAPAADNTLCLQCHAAGGRAGLKPAAPIVDPIAHGHHLPGSKGNQCIECHMPQTTYMQRHARRDHGFLSPDPLLTQELGIPNACSRCHADKTVEWSIAAATRWYGEKLDNRQRQRARVVAAAQRGDADAAQPLLALLASEPNPSWRATLLLLARPYAAHVPAVLTAARAALRESDPDVRSAAVQVCSTDATARQSLPALLKDPVKLVRLDAESALSPELPPTSVERQELDAHLAVSLDQPSGQAKLGDDLLRRGRTGEALLHFRQAVAWDPGSAGLHRALGLALATGGENREAALQLAHAAELVPQDPALPFEAALAYAADANGAAAVASLREAVRRDPKFHRAWYNLGLLLAQQRENRAAEEALRTAVAVTPAPEYYYALATVLWQNGDYEGAREAARQTLAQQPDHADAAAMLHLSRASP